jgi:biotin transport system substrate-specific component
MSTTTLRPVLSEIVGPSEGVSLRVKQALLIVLGVAALTIAAKIRVPMWPVPITMQTFAVLVIGAAYGTRLGLATLVAYLALGAAGVAVFTGDGAGLAYMMGPTGGYLVGFAVAAGVMGWLAARGWDRTVTGMAGALLIGNAVIYAFGLPWMAWLFAAERGMAWVDAVGDDQLPLRRRAQARLAALVLPAAWRLVGRARG